MTRLSGHSFGHDASVVRPIRADDLLVEHQLPIVSEVELPVVHQLLALPGTALSSLRRIYSHPQALAQCERFLRRLTGIEIVATYDTAGSAKLVATDRLTDAAAIGTALQVRDNVDRAGDVPRDRAG